MPNLSAVESRPKGFPDLLLLCFFLLFYFSSNWNIYLRSIRFPIARLLLPRDSRMWNEARRPSRIRNADHLLFSHFTIRLRFEKHVVIQAGRVYQWPPSCLWCFVCEKVYEFPREEYRSNRRRSASSSTLLIYQTVVTGNLLGPFSLVWSRVEHAGRLLPPTN